MDRDTKDNAIDNRLLIDQIDSLEDDSGAIKSDKKGKITETFVILIILGVILFAFGIYIDIKKDAGTSKQISVIDAVDEKDSEMYYDFEDNIEIIDDSEEYYDNEDYFYEEYNSFDEEENRLKQEFENQKKNIVIQTEDYDISDDLVIILKNNNLEAIEDFDVYAVFFDGENNIVDVKVDSVGYLNNDAIFPIVFTDIPTNFEFYKIFIKKEYFYDTSYENYTDEIEFEAEMGEYHGESIIIKGKNNSNKKIECVDFAVIYYDENDNILDVAIESEYDIRKGQSFEIESWGPYNRDTYETVKFSRYDVSIISAYNFVY